MRLIDADKLAFVPKNCISQSYMLGVRGVFEYIDSVPTVDAVPVRHGKWIIEDGHVCCSECGEISKEYNWCPYCGADMKGEGDERNR